MRREMQSEWRSASKGNASERGTTLDAFMMVVSYFFYLVCTFIIFFHSFMCNFNLALREKRTKLEKLHSFSGFERTLFLYL